MTKIPERCWSCGAPGLHPCNDRGRLARSPSGELVEVTYEYETEDLRQIKLIARVISGANAMVRAFGAVPPSDERARLVREVVDVIRKGLRTANAIVSPMLERVRRVA
ncbi:MULTISPECIES: hypothetical protein [Sorangium]|uniref:hypothetical protein n=1 Tax=Sorangium TaxID=39643 RepID=UPI003D9C2737